jgi:hypothetical protein
MFVSVARDIEVLLLSLHATALGMYALPARVDFFRREPLLHWAL